MKKKDLDENPPQVLAGGSSNSVSIGGSQLLPSARGDVQTADQPLFKGRITREREPVNLEFPFASLDGVMTPNSQFFVRTHFPMPHVSRDDWRLKCRGHVERELVLNYDDLRELPSQTIAATIECAGNSRVFLVPKAEGVQWELGGVGTAEWTGVPLSTVLDRAGIKKGAVEVILQGADKGELTEEPKTPGEIHFARSLPLEKARQEEVILAYQMNGEDLAPEHGFPVRAIVPGWYGMASVKWLTRIEVTDRPFQGYWQTAEYAYWNRYSGEPVGVPVSEMQVKSAIARPMRGERIAPTTAYRVFGAAWSDGADIVKVEVSSDCGQTWKEAKLLGDAAPYMWRLWEFQWQPPRTSGKCTLMSRATDNQDRRQPREHNPDKKAYLINHTLPVEVEVR
ncbi:MAG: sulfite oxidase [Pirellulales bacterium]|nr:sulfite oxidase [Pirellulales bacterium]